MTLAYSHLSENYIVYIFLINLQSRPQMCGIITYLQRKSFFYNMFMLFETENLHFKNLPLKAPPVRFAR